MNTPARASLPVIKRLPKYYRYLCSLQADGINSISSRELAAQMGTTASQVRQDFNCIGDVNGRQGIGYSVENLLSILEGLLFGNGDRLPTILIGCGRLGKAVSRFITTDTNGYRLIAAFDVAQSEVGKEINGIQIPISTSWSLSVPSITPRSQCSVCPVTVRNRSAAVWWIWASRASGTSPTMTFRCRIPMWWWRTSIWATA